MYGNEFGVVKQVSVHNGSENKAVRVVFAYPECEGGGSVDLELCLPIDSMNALEMIKSSWLLTLCYKKNLILI